MIIIEIIKTEQLTYRFTGFTTITADGVIPYGFGERDVDEDHYVSILRNLKVLRDEQLRNDLEDEEIKLLADNLREISEQIKDYLIPREIEGDFIKFLEGIEAYSILPHPQLLIKTNDYTIPWWLAKTIDNEGYWGTRFSLSLLPAYARINESYEDSVSIAIVTRPTIDIYYEKDISDELNKCIESIKEEFTIDSCVIQDGNVCITNGDKHKKNHEYFGVTRKEFLDLIKKHNILLYYGHFTYKENEPNRSFFSLSKEKSQIELTKKSEKITRGAKQLADKVRDNKIKFERISDRVTIDDIESEVDLGNKYFLLGACNSAGIPIEVKQKSVVEFFIPHPKEARGGRGKALIGTIYPVYAKETATFVEKVFKNAFTRKEMLSESLRRAREDLDKAILRTKLVKTFPRLGNEEIEQKVKESIDERDLLHWMAFSLWGHPMTVFSPPPKFPININYSSTVHHVMAPLIKKIIKPNPLSIKWNLREVRDLPIFQRENIFCTECAVPEFIKLLDQGEELIILTPLFQPSLNDCSIYTHKNSRLDSNKNLTEKIKDLKNKKMMRVDSFVSTTLMTKLVFDKEVDGVFDSIDWTNVEYERLNILAQEKYDGAIIIPREFKEANKTPNLIEYIRISDRLKLKDILGEYLPGPLLCTSKNIFLQNIDTFKIFIKRYQESMNLFETQPEEYLQREFNIPADILKIHKPCHFPTEKNLIVKTLIKFSRLLVEKNILIRELVEEDFAYYYIKKKTEAS